MLPVGSRRCVRHGSRRHGRLRGAFGIRAFLKGYWDCFEELRFELESFGCNPRVLKRRRPESNRCRRLCSLPGPGAFGFPMRFSGTSGALRCHRKSLVWGAFGAPFYRPSDTLRRRQRHRGSSRSSRLPPGGKVLSRDGHAAAARHSCLLPRGLKTSRRAHGTARGLNRREQLGFGSRIDRGSAPEPLKVC
jgi:hypothetical protein